MKQLMVAILLTVFAVGSAAAQAPGIVFELRCNSATGF
jgi:hypothetical protein